MREPARSKIEAGALGDRRLRRGIDALEVDLGDRLRERPRRVLRREILWLASTGTRVLARQRLRCSAREPLLPARCDRRGKQLEAERRKVLGVSSSHAAASLR